MKKEFSTSLFGYKKPEVDLYLKNMVKDYEEELRKKKDRIFELAEEVRKLKQQNQDLKERLDKFSDQEKYISRALIAAEQRAQAIVEEGKRKTQEEYENLETEKEKWRNKFRAVRQELLEFEKILVSLIEKFRDDINYYAAEEISETILAGDSPSREVTQNQTDEEAECAPIKDMLKKEDKKKKVIA